MGTIFFKRLLLFFNGNDVDLYIGYFSLKTLHCLVKLIGVRAGGAILSNSVFWGSKKKLGKDVSMVI